VRVVQGDAVLAANEGKPLAKFQQKLLQVVAQQGFQLGFSYQVGLGDFQKLEHIGFTQQVGGLFDELALGGKLQYACLVFAGGQAKEQCAFFLSHQLAYRPVFAQGLLLVEAALQRVVDF
jgi:hypothetical protein